MQRIDGEQLELAYDQLIVALGSVSRTLPIPGLAEHGIGLKSLSDATALRNQVLSCLDIAESLEDPQRRAEYLGFVFVGAGYAGVEGLAELQDFAAQAIELYPRCRAQGMRWVLVEARERIMQEVPASALAASPNASCAGAASRSAPRHDAARGQRARARRSSDGEAIPARTVVWTAGVKPSPVVATARAAARRRRVASLVDRTMRVDDAPTPAGAAQPRAASAQRAPGGVWAIGDCAAVPDASRAASSCPPTAQHAIRQGRLVARNVAATLAGAQARPFRYKTKGVVAELGRNKAVAITLGIRWRGFPAWLIARTYHLLLMPGLRAPAAAAGRLERRAAVRARRLRARAPGSATRCGQRLSAGAPARSAGRHCADVPVARGAYPDSWMAILEQIKSDLQGAMRAGEKDRVGALRLVLSELQKAAKEGADDELAVLRRERKRRLEAARAYRDAGREDLAGGEEAEARADRRLPARRALRRGARRRSSSEAVRDSGAQSAKDMGTAMKQAMAAVDGRADGKRVSGLVRAALQG